jgi:replicative DNA helicase
MSNGNCELQAINMWINSGSTTFLSDNNLRFEYFYVYKPVVVWISAYVDKYFQMPTMATIQSTKELEDIPILVISQFDAMSYIQTELKNNHVFVQGKQLLQKTAEGMNKTESDVGGLLSALAENIRNMDAANDPIQQDHNWTTTADERLQRYLDIHGTTLGFGIPTGIKDLDELTGGWKMDDFVLITARLNNGKSLIGLYFAYQAWVHSIKTDINRPIVFFSTEMPAEEIDARLDTLYAHISNTGILRGTLSEDELHDYKMRLNVIKKEAPPFVIVTQSREGGPITVQDVRRYIDTYNPLLVVVDQLYDIKDVSGERDLRKNIINVTRLLRDINGHTQTAMIVVAQSGRDVEKRRRKSGKDETPFADDVQESDFPAQKATRMVSLHQKSSNIIQMSLRKNRSGKKDVSFFVQADIDRGFYESIAYDEEVF